MNPLIKALGKAISEGDEVAVQVLQDYLIDNPVKPKTILYIVETWPDSVDYKTNYYIIMPIEYPVSDIINFIDSTEWASVAFWTPFIQGCGKISELKDLIHFHNINDNLKVRRALTPQLKVYYLDLLKECPQWNLPRIRETLR